MVLASAISYGITPLFSTKSYVYGFGSTSLTLWSNLIGAILLIPLLIMHQEKIIPEKKYWRDLIITGLFASMTTLVLYQSYVYLPIGVATSIHFCYPMFVMGGECIFYRRKLRRHDLFCIVTVVLGLGMMPEWGGQTEFKGILLALLSGVLFAGYVLRLNKSSAQNVEWAGFTFWMAVIRCSIAALAMLLMDEKMPDIILSSLEMAAAVAVTGSVMAVPLFRSGCRRIGETNAALMSLLEPVTSIITGAVFLREYITPLQLTGCVLVLMAAVIHTAAEIKYLSPAKIVK